MMAKVATVAASLLIAMATIPGSADAVPITVTVDGQQVTGTDSVVLGSGATWTTYGNLKIRARGGVGDAKVVAGTGVAGGKDGTEDELQFINAEIKRFQGSSSAEYHILFEGTFNIPPNTANGTFSYELTGVGSFNTLTTAGNYIKATPNIESPGGTWTAWAPLSHTVNGANYSFFNPPNNSWRNFPAPTVTASRKLKVDVTFKLQSTNDLIKLGTTSGIMLQDGPAHGAGEQPPPHPRVITDKVLFLEEQVLMLEDCLLREENYRKCLEHPPTDNPRGPREELHNIPSMKK